jgi:hypothetical protein
MVGYLPFGLGFEVTAEKTQVAQKKRQNKKSQRPSHNHAFGHRKGDGDLDVRI